MGNSEKTSEVQETNFPKDDPTQANLEIAREQPEDWSPGKGEVWAIWEGLQPGERVLTVKDLRSLGDSRAEAPMAWTLQNRFRVEISNVHPMVLDYIENLDGAFKVVRL